MTRLPLALLVLLVLATPAQAAESFLGVLVDGKATRFTSQAPTGLTTPRAISGLAPRDRVVALAPGFALGRSGTVYRLNPSTLRATATAGRVRLSGQSFSLLPAGAAARVLSDTGQDVTVDLASGLVTPGAGLRLLSGEPVNPAATLLPDGRIAGIDRARETVVIETAPGSNLMSEIPMRNARGDRLRLAEPMAFAVAGDTGFLVSALPKHRIKQSRLISVDLVTGKTTRDAGPYFFRQFAAVLSLGTVRDDRTPPRVTVTHAPARVSARDLRTPGKVRVGVRCSEGCSVIVSTVIARRSSVGGFAARDLPATMELHLSKLSRRAAAALPRAVGGRAYFQIRAWDWAGNLRIVRRSFRVVA